MQYLSTNTSLTLSMAALLLVTTQTAVAADGTVNPGKEKAIEKLLNNSKKQVCMSCTAASVF